MKHSVFLHLMEEFLYFSGGIKYFFVDSIKPVMYNLNSNNFLKRLFCIKSK